MRDFKKNISNKDARHSKTSFLNKDAIKDAAEQKSHSAEAEAPKIIDKGMTTSSMPGFLSTTEGNELIKDTFRSKPNIVKALKEELGLTYVNQIPRSIEKLVAIKGIGVSSANHILGELS